jgi:hypothetical protein
MNVTLVQTGTGLPSSRMGGQLLASQLVQEIGQASVEPRTQRVGELALGRRAVAQADAEHARQVEDALLREHGERRRRCRGGRRHRAPLVERSTQR